MITTDSASLTTDTTVVTTDGGGAASVNASAVLLQLCDLFHYFGTDLSVSNRGDLLSVVGTTRGQQRVLRRLLTNPGDYIWEPTYGGGLAQFIGSPIDIAKVTAVIRSQLALESVVATTPAPQVSVSQLPSNYSAFDVNISYVDAAALVPVVLFFTVSN